MVYYQSIQVIRINWYYIYYEQTIFLLQIILENNWFQVWENRVLTLICYKFIYI